MPSIMDSIILEVCLKCGHHSPGQSFWNCMDVKLFNAFWMTHIQFHADNEEDSSVISTHVIFPTFVLLQCSLSTLLSSSLRWRVRTGMQLPILWLYYYNDMFRKNFECIQGGWQKNGSKLCLFLGCNELMWDFQLYSNILHWWTMGLWFVSTCAFRLFLVKNCSQDNDFIQFDSTNKWIHSVTGL